MGFWSKSGSKQPHVEYGGAEGTSSTPIDPSHPPPPYSGPGSSIHAPTSGPASPPPPPPPPESFIWADQSQPVGQSPGLQYGRPDTPPTPNPRGGGFGHAVGRGVMGLVKTALILGGMFAGAVIGVAIYTAVQKPSPSPVAVDVVPTPTPVVPAAVAPPKVVPAHKPATVPKPAAKKPVVKHPVSKPVPVAPAASVYYLHFNCGTDPQSSTQCAAVFGTFVGIRDTGQGQMSLATCNADLAIWANQNIMQGWSNAQVGGAWCSPNPDPNATGPP
jgi:hypothetical protein